jgi:F-type H+-transporting ATPase subunit gamma
VATLRDIQRRIRSVQSTQKITRAMKLVAAAKLRRAQERILAARPYANKMAELLGNLVSATDAGEGASHPLLEQREGPRRLIVVITADRGLAGAFNAQVLRRAFALERELRRDGVEVKWLASGRRGRSTLTFRRYALIQAWQGFSERPEYADAQAIAQRASELYANQEVDRVVVIYNRYKSPLVQLVTVQDLLPIPEKVIERSEGEAERADLRSDFIYEPEPEQILERLLPVYVETELYRALLESAASEQGARMTAMRNASKNAGELISNLTLAMNRARQAEITQEILEVVAGADALTA